MAAEHADPQQRERRLDDVIVAYLEAVEAGARPDPDDWLRRHPDLADELAEFFRDQQQFDSLVAPLRSPNPSTAPHEPRSVADATPRPDGNGTVPLCVEGRPAFGDYELLGEIARGGMGVVYKARQVSLNRTVALKMILAGQFASADDVQRFRLEAEAAASLDHPNIVPIYEVGARDGQPYFSMKLIDGGKLTAHVHQYVRQPRSAARVLATVARAVEHAHQRGLLHRDLKPANILLDHEGQPHVTDFGLAKRVSAGRDLTRSGCAVGTPSYMAPEQAAGPRAALTTAADVYSLGAVLYEMLTGRPPFRAETPLETLLEVVEREPDRPRALNPRVHRDLETICLKCLHKEPGKRYASAAALADELERYLRGEPIQARPSSALERAWRWCRRKPLVASLFTALALAVVGGLAGMGYLLARAKENAAEARLQKAEADRNAGEARLQKAEADRNAGEAQRQRQRAEENLHKAQQAVKDLSFRFSERLNEVPGLLKVRKELLEAGLQYSRDFLRQRGPDPSQDAQLADIELRVVQLASMVGTMEEARDAYLKAFAVFQELLRTDPDNPHLQDGLGHICTNLGSVLQATGQTQAAFEKLRLGRDLYERLYQRNPNDPHFARALSGVCTNLGTVHRAAGRVAESLACFQEAHALLEQLVRRHPKNGGYQGSLAVCLINVGIVQGVLGQKEEALKAYEQARLAQEKLLRADSRNQNLARDLALNYRRIGERAVNSGQPAEGKRLLLQGQSLLKQLLRDHPNNAHYQGELAASHRGLGHAYRDLGDEAQALACYEQARVLQEKLVQKQPAAVLPQSELALTWFCIALFEAKHRRPDQALQAYQKCRELRAKLVETDPENMDHRSSLAGVLNNIGLLLGRLGRPQEGIPCVRQAIELQQTAFTRAALVPKYREQLRRLFTALAELQRQAGEPAEAALTIQRGRDLIERLARDHPDVVEYRADLAAFHNAVGHVHRDSGQLTQSLTSYEQARAVLEKVVATEATAEYRGRLARTLFNLGNAYGLLGQRPEELRSYEHARDLQQALVSEMPADLEALNYLNDTLNNLGVALARANRFEEALAALRRAVEQQRTVEKRAPRPGQYRKAMSTRYGALAEVLRVTRRTEEAAAVLLERRQLWPGNAAELFLVGRDLARIAQRVGQGKAALSEGEKAERERHAAAAVETLRQAVAAGYRDLPNLRNLPDLAVLRERDDFRQLVGGGGMAGGMTN
jgi:serine/threonine-protein kinase